MNNITKASVEKYTNKSYDLNKYIIEKSKDDKHVIKINRDEKNVFMGSKYNVSRDISDFMKQISDYNIYTIFIVFGLGAGEHILELINNISEKNKILIVEPDENIINLVSNMDYFKSILEDDRIALCKLGDIDLNFVFGSVIEEFNFGNLKLMVYSNYNKVFEEEYSNFYKDLRDFIDSSTMNLVTSLMFSETFFQCYVRNMKHIIKSTFLNELKGKYNNIPAVVVSAGPSLEKNIKLLKEVKDEFIIITGGRTTKSVLDLGVIPDFVCSVDPGKPSYNTIKDALECEAPLIYCECTSYDIVNEYKGRKVFFHEGVILKNVTPKIIGTTVDNLSQGGSVAHICTSLAAYMNCNPIIFIGQDLAYTNEKIHADIATVDSEENEVIEDNNIVMVKDIYGNYVRTSRVFDSFRRSMEGIIKNNKKNSFINSTEGGANIHGTEVKSFRAVIDEYKHTKEYEKNKIKIEFKEDNIDKELVKKNIEKIVANLDEIKKDCKKALKYSDEILDYYEKGKEKNIIKLFDKIKEVNNKIQEITFIDTMLKPIIYRTLMDSQYFEKQNESVKEKGERFARQIKNLYKGILKAIDKSEPYIEECIEELK